MEQKRRPPCVLCQGDHGLGRCEQFRAQSAQQRYEILMREKRYLLCFQRGHVVAHCVCDFTCAKCSKKHHTLIHEAKEIGDRAFLGLGEEEDDDWEGAEETLHYGMLTMPNRARVSLRTLPIWIANLRSLKLLPPVGDGTVDVMIGNSYPAFMVSLQEVVGEAGEPVARLTRLGWTVAGPTVPGCTLERMEKQKAFLIRQAAPVHWQGAEEA